MSIPDPIERHMEDQAGLEANELKCSNCQKVFRTEPIPENIRPDSNLICIDCLSTRNRELFDEVKKRSYHGVDKRRKR